ncbi:recombinase family protein [Pukyongiella litopenaei]|uniref:recombinase family protein n=1 Tax=Pukyongiella litopenaei TaxID=2605946 RepID=UPI00313D7217
MRAVLDRAAGKIRSGVCRTEDGDRPKLDKALKLARLAGATLVIAKPDRLSRNAAFLQTLRDSGATAA